MKLTNKQIVEKTTMEQEKFYSNRIGQVFGVWKVINVHYDWDKRVQKWTMECQKCRKTKVINKPKLRDIATTCSCEKPKNPTKIKKEIIKNDDVIFIGKIYGNFKIIGFKRTTGKRQEIRWICKCLLCGDIASRIPSKLKNKQYPLCKCQLRNKQIKYDDTYIGKSFGRLKVVGFGKEHNFICECRCGNIKEYVPKNVVSGAIVSCGCYSKEITIDRMTTHGGCSGGEIERVYRIWNGMKQRCNNTNNDHYNDYGGRGIRICDEWLNDYEIFKQWALSNGYSDELSIDRIDNDKGYCPDNCRWTTSKVQRWNQRPHKKHKKQILWEIDGITKPAIDWCNEYNISLPTVQYRIKTKGMKPHEALTAQKSANGRPNRK